MPVRTQHLMTVTTLPGHQHSATHGNSWNIVTQLSDAELFTESLPEIFGAIVATLFTQLPFQGNLPTLTIPESTRRPGVRTFIMTANPTSLNGVGDFSGYCPFYYPTRKHSQVLLLTNRKTFHCSTVYFTHISLS
jgi:hypothetical protein